MSNKPLFFLAAISLFASTAAADPLRYRSQPERDRAWVIDAKGYSSKKAASAPCDSSAGLAMGR